jgi:hypothetical protein
MGCGIVRPDDVSLEQEQVAYNLARLVAYDMSAVDRDDPQAMRGTLRVRVDPAARRPVDFLASPRTPLAEIEFAEQPDPERAYILPPMLGDERAPTVQVLLTCRVESDGSLICRDRSRPAGDRGHGHAHRGVGLPRCACIAQRRAERGPGVRPHGGRAARILKPVGAVS